MCVVALQVFLRQSKALFPDLSAPTGFRSEEEWVLDTEGVNLMGVSRSLCLVPALTSRATAVV